MPVIAIPPCAKMHDYEESIRRAGGEVRLLVRDVDKPADVIASVDGILLPGGGDIDPARFGEARHPATDEVSPARDDLELGLTRRAVADAVPLFAICRGIQVLNVARGGSLVQDIPSELKTTIEHRLAVPPHEAIELAHEIWMEEDSLLARLIGESSGADTTYVNSRHHQAIKELGEGLVTTATAPDGLIEAVEDPSRRFFVGVQWHPENFYRTGEFRSLFEGFVKAANG